MTCQHKMRPAALVADNPDINEIDQSVLERTKALDDRMLFLERSIDNAYKDFCRDAQYLTKKLRKVVDDMGYVGHCFNITDGVLFVSQVPEHPDSPPIEPLDYKWFVQRWHIKKARGVK